MKHGVGTYKRAAGRHRILLSILGVCLVIGAGYALYTLSPGEVEVTAYEGIENEYIAFVAESYDIIQREYWEILDDEKLSELFRLSLNNVTGEAHELISKDRAGVESLVASSTLEQTETAGKELVTLTVHTVLQNLQPAGRSALFTMQKETELRNTVANINPEKDLYNDLGLPKSASTEEVEKAYVEKKKVLEADTSPEAETELEKVEYAKEVLTDEVQKETYDTTGAEPTVFAEELNENTARIKISQLSPVTFNEFIRVSDSLTNEGLNTLIFDLRGNIGGAVDVLPWFLGPFIGPNQYAYDFFHQEEYEPFKTQVGWLPSLEKYKRVVVLIDGNTQSSGEIMAGALKRYNVGVLLGERTRGWGTIENTFPLQTTLDGDSYSLFLVHSITLRPDGQPIEGRGIDPNISISSETWKEELNTYFNDAGLIQTVERILNSK